MSGFLTDAADLAGFGAELNSLRDFLGLRGLMPGSFRGVPFHVDDHERSGGRRIAIHEKPLSDRTRTEDLGRAKREFEILAYVIGEDWKERRDALLSACEDYVKPGTLVLPTGWEVVARCTTVRVSEAALNVATFDLCFVEAAGEDGGLKVSMDTASALRRTIGQVLRLVRAGFALAYAARGFGDLVGRAAASTLAAMGEGFAEKYLGLPGLDLAATSRSIMGVRMADVAAPADAVLAPSRAVADAALNAPRQLSAPMGADTTSSRGEPPSSRRDAALALLAVAQAPLVPPGAPSGVIAQRLEANRLALDTLSRDNATLMAAEVLSATDFSSMAEARQLRNALLGAIDDRAEAAANAGQDDAYRGWRGLAAAASRDMTERAQRAPLVAAYSVPMSLPSLTLSQRLYQAGGRADELVGLNDVPHPAFMSIAGQALRR
nr:DNA circularization N-terminal domain-containing protein [uncultured Roseococcus sp.]